MINNIIAEINIVLLDYTLSQNTIYHTIQNDYILLSSLEIIKPFRGKLAVSLNLVGLVIKCVEVSIIY